MAYIRKEDLINKIKPEQKDDYEHFVSIANVRKILRNFVESVAEVDAVEVVRCDKCKHRETMDCPMSELLMMAEGDYEILDKTPLNGFCSCGERREDG